jgi:PucR family transcriptional regulator, purine catabolism regulatory protein
MVLSLKDVLSDATFQKAAPVVRAGADSVDRTQVRWIHSSEVIDIAPLLSGGELLLTGGQSLAAATPEERRRYIQALAGRGVAALAVETGGVLKAVPQDLVAEAEAAGLPLIELTQVAPFVEIAEAINSLMVGQSVELMRRADLLSQQLASALAEGADLKQLLGILAGILPAHVTVYDRAGEMLERADPPNTDGPENGDGAALDFDIALRGGVAASLRLLPANGYDSAWYQTAGNRSAGILALALQHRLAPSLTDVAGTELLRSVASGIQGLRLVQLCKAAGMQPEAPFVALVARPEAAVQRWAPIEQCIRKSVRNVAVYVQQSDLMAVAGLPAESTRAARAALVRKLADGMAGQSVVVAVGPMGYGIGQASQSMAEARLTVELSPAGLNQGGVLDADDFAIERLALKDPDGAGGRQLVRELLGEVMEYDDAKGSRLLDTLAAWLASGCNTAQTARSLFLERQSLHSRLDRIFGLIGGDPRGTERLAGLHLAVRLARFLDRQ